ncbi:hypothetical protein [Sphingobacterium siyangense]
MKKDLIPAYELSHLSGKLPDIEIRKVKNTYGRASVKQIHRH